MRRVEAFNKALYDLNPNKNKGFEIKNVDGKLEAFIYGDIGEWSVNALDFVNELRNFNGQDFDLHINSPGGFVNEGITIYNAIKQYPGNVTAYVDGQAASAASFIAMAADKIVIAKTGQMMIHDALSVSVGNWREMEADMEMLKTQSNRIAGIYADRAGGTNQEWLDRMAEEPVYIGQEAVDIGLADEVYGEVPSQNRSLMSTVLAASATPVVVEQQVQDEFAWLSDVDLSSALTNAFKEAS